MIRANNWVMWVLFAASLMVSWLCGIAVGAGPPETESPTETLAEVAPAVSVEQAVAAATSVPTPSVAQAIATVAPLPTRPVEQTVATVTPVPTRSVDEVAAMAVLTIMGYPRIRDAAVGQDGKTLNLVLIVDYATDPGYAQQLGDNFVRLTKSLLQDGETPSERIGTGEYDYLIGVYYPDEKRVVMGAKSRTSDRISW